VGEPTGSPHHVSARTHVAAIIGDPVRHSLSPAIYNAAFTATGLDWVFVAFEVPAAGGADAVRACRALGLDGLAVTMPHKDAAAATVDVLTPRAATLGAVNCIVRRDGDLLGDSTDGAGFVASLRADADVDPAGSRAVVLGAGGAARAIVVALAEAGAAEVVVVNRTPEPAAVAASLVPVGRVGTAADVGSADLVVNATSVGMAVTGDPESTLRLPVEADRLRPDQVVADIVYHPESTALLAAAADLGATTVGGLGMLVHQAALNFTAWTGHDAPLATMWAAAREGLRDRP
jgi:shikimate dehydrogenase